MQDAGRPRTTTAVTDDPDLSRYEAREDGALVAVAEYRRARDLVVFTHTQVEGGHEGRGVASQLVRQALDDVRRQGLQVVPACSFVRAWIERHPDPYAGLVFRSPTVVGERD